ncbi:hypothetical protein GCM10010277_70490 [Streptomyces longisporoflavus]|nr:hypothetical protein GCM10010277_70490 [Streptomyces longisporoflavus]
MVTRQPIALALITRELRPALRPMSWVSQMENSDQDSDQVTKNMKSAALIRVKFRPRLLFPGVVAAGLSAARPRVAGLWAAGLWVVMGAPSRWALRCPAQRRLMMPERTVPGLS